METSYKEKYEKALEKAKALYGSSEPMSGCSVILETIFPELKSEDEKIRKEIISALKYANHKGVYDKHLAWLEKQGQVKESTISLHEIETCKENDDSLTSEDERIRKDIKQHFLYLDDSFPDKAKWLAWLEKQGAKDKFIEKELGCIKGYREKAIKRLEELEKQDEQKASYTTIAETGDGGINALVTLPIEMKSAEESLGIDSDTYNKIVDECIGGEQEPADKVEPKFREGEWITNGDYTWIIVGIKPLDYVLQSQDGNIVDDTISHVDEQFHSFTIQDAKDGDILCTYECDEPKIVFILKGTPKKHYALSYHCYYNIMYPHFESDSEKGCLAPNDEDVKPATKEQCDLLFEKMHEAGYEWNDKKELRKIEQWSEEDERNLQGVIDEIEANKNQAPDYDLATYDRFLSWLKSLKGRVQPKVELTKLDKTS